MGKAQQQERLRDLISQMGHEDWQYESWHRQLAALQDVPTKPKSKLDTKTRRARNRRIRAFETAGFDPEKPLPEGFLYQNGHVLDVQESKVISNWINERKEAGELPKSGTAAFFDFVGSKLQSMRAA